MNSDFEPPPKGLSVLVTIGGVITAFGVIAGLEFWSSHLSRPAATSASSEITAATPTQTTLPSSDSRSLAQLDVQSMKSPGQPVNSAQLSDNTVYVAPGVGELSTAEKAIARQAWAYFQRNWNEETGLVNSVDGFPSVTMWDQAAAIAALVSAKELDIVTTAEFEVKLNQTLKSLETIPLYRGELPNKVYNAKTLMPVNYGQTDRREEIGWSAIDLGRLALWLKIVEARYPAFQPQVQAVWDHWKVERLVKNGQMYGTAIANGKEQYNQEGRLGYESYAAYGLQLWGLNVDKALNVQTNAAFVDLYDVGIPYDKRDYETSGANNYVLSEPYILDGIETGFQSLPRAYSDRILAAQAARYEATGQLTAVTEDNLDRAPYFVYGTLFANGKPWSTITDVRQEQNDLRFLSAKAAIGWHVLYNTDYTHKLFDFVQVNLKSKDGWYNGFYESLQQPNKALTANNNGVILESLLYKQVGQPLIVWAGVETPR